MYHYLDDKEFVHNMRRFGGELMQQLCHYLKEDYDIGATFYLVGSGARNLILQNANKPVDLDYNLEIVRCDNFKDCRNLKECVRKTLNICLNEYDLSDCQDSTIPLTTEKIQFKFGNETYFSIDICITTRDEKNNYYRLVHKKTGCIICDDYFWNPAPKSKNLNKKVKTIKSLNKWGSLREEYLRIKNLYLRQNDTKNHPSFVCYIEAVNNVYNSIKQ